MSYKKDRTYRDIPFSSETPQEDFFLYDAISNLHTKCESNRDTITKVRTVGILENKNGCFYLKQMNTKRELYSFLDPSHSIQVSMAYVRRSIGCSTMPYPVQIFGTLQWCRSPVIFAQIIQPLSVAVATILNETMIRTSNLHSRKHDIELKELSHCTD